MGTSNQVLGTGHPWFGTPFVNLAVSEIKVEDCCSHTSPDFSPAFACFAGSTGSTGPPTPSGSNQTCAQGLQHTPEQWAAFVRNAYPGYTGKRPRMQVIHGLADTLVRPQCGYEQLKQWSAVLGLTNTNNVTGSSVPEGSQYTQINYGDGSQLVGYFGQGVGHFALPNEPVMLKFFGLL